MANLNKVMLMGNLTRDPQMKYLPSQMAVADFAIATNRKWKDPQGGDREEVTFIDITAFGKQAELINQYFTKGKPIYVEGRLKLDQWEDKNGGGKRSKLHVVLEGFQFIGGRDGGSGEGGGGGGGRSAGGYDEYNQDSGGPPPARPMRNAGGNRPPVNNSGGRPAPKQEAPKQPFGDEQQFNDDDIPF